MTAATETKERNGQTKNIPPFTIMADHHRNCDLLLQCIPGMRLRSAISSSRTVKDAKTGQEMVPRDQAAGLGSLPYVPGMMLSVNPATCEYVVSDPLTEDEALCEQLRRRSREMTGMRMDSKLKGVPTQRGKLDVDRMKSLCRECLRLVEAKEATVKKGVMSDLEDIDAMPGRYLLNPGAQVANSQPRYEDQWDEYLQNLHRVGG